MNTEYQPEMWTVRKDVIDSAISGLEAGVEYAHEALIRHDKELGRTTRKNKLWAEIMESDIRNMETTLEALRALREDEH